MAALFFGERGDRMDLREYYRTIRDKEREIAEPFVTVVSLKTLDGGRAGRKTIVPRTVAAKLIVDGKVELEARCC
jgi:hypothetical protein